MNFTHCPKDNCKSTLLEFLPHRVDGFNSCLKCGNTWYDDMNGPDMVNHPPHYNNHPSGVECIQITRHMNFNLGNCFKYIWRAGHKNDLLEDLQKAQFYLNDEIKRIENERSKST